ncbi:SDR family oxidoreductase [Pseudokineococcus basanitobsidens]|uniref:SDR family oxidoreductase n=2 Tax=Pseudokineococcus basanitobsidens TaxID=1926649 RepID=A0ABU8RHN7_9ACTN
MSESTTAPPTDGPGSGTGRTIPPATGPAVGPHGGMAGQRELGTVYVTGGSSGLGAAVVEVVTALGGTAAVVDRDAPASGAPHALADVADAASVERAVAELVERVGPPTAVVTAAGTDAVGRLEDVPAERWAQVVGVNLVGTAAAVRACLPHLKASRGVVVTVSSSLGLRAASDATAYCASKFGVVGLTRALQLELAGEVGVTMLVPAGMRTKFFDGRTEQYKPGPDADLMDPRVVAHSVVHALRQPVGTEVREMVVTVSTEPSWP